MRLKLPRPIYVTLIAGLAIGVSAGTHAPKATEIPVRGVVKAVDQAALSTDLIARIDKIGFRIGERFKKGDLLIAFDCERVRAEAQSAEAVWNEARLALQSNKTLDKYGAVGRHDIEISKARVDKADAERRALNSRVAQCEIHAPFDGTVSELSVNAHELPLANQPFMSIVGDGRFEIELIVPSNWLAWLKPGVKFTYTLDETGQTYDAQVRRIGAAVDAVSQMIKVVATFDQPPSDVLSGMSGAAKFDLPRS